MIAKAHSIPHGASMMNYAMAKPHAHILRTHNLPDGISPESIWAEMQLHQSDTSGLRPAYPPVKNYAIRFELSPQNEETDGWKAIDYENLIDEFNAEMIKQNNAFLSKGKPYNFDLDNTQYIAALHFDSKGGIRHIHIVANRIDMDGQVIDDHNIGRRIVAAIHTVNVRHGWELPEDIHDDHLQQINEACMDALAQMPVFSWDEYGSLLEKKGLKLKVKKDSTGEVVGYNVFWGRSKFKASDLGKGRNLTVRNILNTWSKIHAERPAPKPELKQPVQTPAPKTAPTQVIHSPAPQQRYARTITVDGKPVCIDLPLSIYGLFKDNCAVPEGNDSATIEDVTKAGIMLFMGLVDAATSISESHGGGGSQPESGWGRKEDEDERRWALRCAQMATEMFKPKPIRRSYHR